MRKHLMLLIIGLGMSIAIQADVFSQSPQSAVETPVGAVQRATCAGVPIYHFGFTPVYGICPDFETNVVIQKGNTNPQIKIKPKKSWEIAQNGIGWHLNSAPRSPQSDYQWFLPVNLIDGDPSTAWISRGQTRPNYEPVWIRIDLPDNR